MEENESKVDNNLDKVIFGKPTTHEPAKTKIVSLKSVASTETGNKDHDKDYREVRDNLKRIIAQSEDAIQGVLEVASETQSSRAYEVAAQLIQATLEANNKLINLHKQLKEIKREDAVKLGGSTTNNIFVGNTAELSRFLRARKELESATKELPPNEDIIDVG